MQSLRGKATSEWSLWKLTYEHALRRAYDASYVARLDIDYVILREKCERGENPVELVKNGFVPIVSQKSKARMLIEQRKVLAAIENMKVERKASSWVRACCVISLVIIALCSFLAYNKWSDIQSARDTEAAHAQWRKDIGLDN